MTRKKYSYAFQRNRKDPTRWCIIRVEEVGESITLKRTKCYSVRGDRIQESDTYNERDSIRWYNHNKAWRIFLYDNKKDLKFAHIGDLL